MPLFSNTQDGKLRHTEPEETPRTGISTAQPEETRPRPSPLLVLIPIPQVKERPCPTPTPVPLLPSVLVLPAAPEPGC